MGRAVSLGLCLLGCLVFGSTGTEVEGAEKVAVAARSQCPPGVLYYKEFCYEFVDRYVDREDAEVSCLRRDEAHLASILSSTEGRILVSYLKRKRVNSCTWIGLAGTYMNRYMAWKWSDGSSFSGSLWDGRSPSTGYSSAQCICLTNIQNSNSQKWEQRSCDGAFPFVCKYRSFF